MALLLKDLKLAVVNFADLYIKKIITEYEGSLSKAFGYKGNKLKNDLKVHECNDFDIKKIDKKEAEYLVFKMDVNFAYIEFVLK